VDNRGNSHQPDFSRALGVLAGTPVDPKQWIPWIQSASWIVAADSAADYLVENQLSPDVVIGDLDSLKTPRDQFTEVIADDDPMTTDCDKLLSCARSSGVSKLTLINLEGGLTDHFIAALQSIAKSDLDVRCIFQQGSGWIVKPLFPRRKLAIDRVSLLPIAVCLETTFSGVQWPLDCVTLDPLGATSISNRVTSKDHFVYAQVKSGAALLFIETSGDPNWEE